MERFRLEHPADRFIVCDHSDCGEIADYLELDEGCREELVCAAHTSSQRQRFGSARPGIRSRAGRKQGPCQALVRGLKWPRRQAQLVTFGNAPRF